MCGVTLRYALVVVTIPTIVRMAMAGMIPSMGAVIETLQVSARGGCIGGVGCGSGSRGRPVQ